jgi:uncharacterized protein YndB with AHSA1/START domain
VYREVKPPARLVYTWVWENHPVMGSGEALVTVDLIEANGWTEVRLRHEGFEKLAVRDRHAQGWPGCFDKLEKYLGISPSPGDVAELKLVIMREFDAPRELVWKAWTERERLIQWFGPKGFTMPVAKIDFRPGGVCHSCLRSPDGREMWGKFIYREIVAPERLVYVQHFSNRDGGVTQQPMSPTWPLQMLTTVTVAEQKGKTLLTVQWLPLNPTDEERRTFDSAHEGMKQGWGGTFEQLAEYLAKA